MPGYAFSMSLMLNEFDGLHPWEKIKNVSKPP